MMIASRRNRRPKVCAACPPPSPPALPLAAILGFQYQLVTGLAFLGVTGGTISGAVADLSGWVWSDSSSAAGVVSVDVVSPTGLLVTLSSVPGTDGTLAIPGDGGGIAFVGCSGFVAGIAAGQPF